MAAASVRTPESLEDAAADPPALETALGGLTPAASASLSSEPTPGAPADVEDAGDDASSAESAEKSSAGQEQGGEPDATNDDYSKTFDSPPAEEAEAQSEKDVPSTSQEPSAAAGPPESVPAAPTTTGQPMQPTPVAEQLVVQAKPSDTTLAQTGDQDGGSDEAPGVDITRLVAEIAARADASSTEPPKPPMIPSASAATPLSTLPPQPQASLIAAASPSLPPKPAATAQAAHQTPPFIHPETFKRFQQGMPGGPSPTSAAPSIPMELASPSQPQSATSLTSSAFPPYNAVPFDPNLPAHLRPRPSLTPQEVQSRWEMFLEDEHRFTTEAKWDSFPDRSRIFVGKTCKTTVIDSGVLDL